MSNQKRLQPSFGSAPYDRLRLLCARRRFALYILFCAAVSFVCGLIVDAILT